MGTPNGPSIRWLHISDAHIRDPGGHSISAAVLAKLNDWLGEILSANATPA